MQPTPDALSRPIFVLSFRQRDELAAMIAAEGWRVIAARRDEGAAARLAASGAPVAIVDARGAIEEGLAAIHRLAPLIAASGGALLALLSKVDSQRIGEVYDAGATHFLLSPMSKPEILQALRFACRYVDRLGSPTSAQPLPLPQPVGFRYDPADRSLQVTPALEALLAERHMRASPSRLLALLDRADRPLVRAALARLTMGQSTTAFTAEIGTMGRAAVHLQHDARAGRLHGLVEPMVQPSEPSMAVREALNDLRDVADARRWIDRRLKEHARIAVILMSIGQLPAINAEYGRGSGDLLLGAIRRRIESPVRELFGKRAIVARLGGADFVAAMADPEDARVEVALARIEEALRAPFLLGDRSLSLDVQLGAWWNQPAEPAATLLKRASGELAAQQEVPAVTPHAASVTRQSLDQLARDVAAAMDEDQLDILFQPQVEVATGRITGVEALARWRHPALGELGAETLFAAAARAGIDGAVSDHVQAAALQRAALWPDRLADLRLSINVTAADIARPEFVEALLDRVERAGFPRSRLTIEITETGLMQDLADAAQLLARLRTAGCRVAIDDFGTGYSSLAYLKALPLDYLKIDRRLSQDIAGSARDRVVVRGVIDMARALGLVVIAEGVETERQLALLAGEGCQFYQGYLCAEPLSSDVLADLVQAQA